MPGTVAQPINGPDTGGPQCMSGFVNNDYLYGVWVKMNAFPVAYRWDSLTNTFEIFDLSTIAGDPLDTPTYIVSDTHYAYHVGVAPDAAGTADEMYIAGNHHDSADGTSPTTGHFVKCSNVADFTNPASWSLIDDVLWDSLDGDPNPQTYTYHHFDRLSNGTLLHFFSQSEAFNVSRGRDYLAFKLIEGVWSPIVSNGHFAITNTVASGDTPGDEANRVYVQAIYVDKNDRVHVTGNWRYADADGTSGNGAWYLYSDNLITWFHKATLGGDVAHTMPLTWANRAGAEITGQPPTMHSGRKSLYVDPVTGFPRVVIRDQGTSNFYAFFWTVTGWSNELLPAQGGEHQDVLWRGERWRRTNSTTRVSLSRAAGGLTIPIGTGIKSAGVNYSMNPDPIWLRERDVYTICLGDGDDPLIYQLFGLSGGGPRTI